MRFAISSDGESFAEPLIFDNPGDYESGLKVVEDAVSKLSLGGKITASAGGVAGTFDKEKKMLLHAPHLLDWVGKNIVKDLRDIIGADVFIENDSAIVGLGEAVSGAGKGFDIVMYLTVSTGVGGARIVYQKIDKSSMGFEPGHQIIDFSGAVEPRFNMLGTLEEFVSGTSVLRRTGKSVKDISQNDIIWKELAEQLAYGVYNSMLHWSPDIIVLGGSMITGTPAIPIDIVSQCLRNINRVFDVLPTVKIAKLKDVGGIYGALAYIK